MTKVVLNYLTRLFQSLIEMLTDFTSSLFGISIYLASTFKLKQLPKYAKHGNLVFKLIFFRSQQVF
jgi:hypothetical protein